MQKILFKMISASSNGKLSPGHRILIVSKPKAINDNTAEFHFIGEPPETEKWIDNDTFLGTMQIEREIPGFNPFVIQKGDKFWNIGTHVDSNIFTADLDVSDKESYSRKPIGDPKSVSNSIYTVGDEVMIGKPSGKDSWGPLPIKRMEDDYYYGPTVWFDDPHIPNEEFWVQMDRIHKVEKLPDYFHLRVEGIENHCSPSVEFKTPQEGILKGVLIKKVTHISNKDMSNKQYWMTYGTCPQCRLDYDKEDTIVSLGGGYTCSVCEWNNGG